MKISNIICYSDTTSFCEKSENLGQLCTFYLDIYFHL